MTKIRMHEDGLFDISKEDILTNTDVQFSALKNPVAQLRDLSQRSRFATVMTINTPQIVNHLMRLNISSWN